MSKKLQKRVNGGFAIYFGVGSLLATIMLVVVTFVQLYRLIFKGVEIGWDVFLLSFFLLLLFGGLSYALLRIGYEEIEGD